MGFNRSRIVSAIVPAMLLFSSVVGASREDPAAELVPERDALIDKIVRGEELEASIRKFRELAEKRRAILATAQGVRDRDQPQLSEAVRKERDEYRKTSDYEVGWRCTLSADPKNPVPSREGRFLADWGKVVRKERVTLAGKNAFDEGEPATIYEIDGVGQRWLIRGEKFRHDRSDFVAEKGDLVLVCRSSVSRDKRMPAPYNEQPMVMSGFAVRIAEPPRIAKKMKWNPIHITGTNYYWAIKDAKWKYPPEEFVLSNVEIARDLGGGRFAVDAEHGMFWVMQARPDLPKKNLLQPGRRVWAILGAPEPDKQLKTWVFPIQDLEERYIIEK